MVKLTENESKVLLFLFRDFSVNYNATSIAKKVDITRRGALKILKNLSKKKLVISRQYGKAVFYKVNLEDQFAFRVIETLLMEEAREKGSRWIWEFEDSYKFVEIAIVFGSAVKDYKKANDIDAVLIFKRKDFDKITKFVNFKNNVLKKPIHPIKQTLEDLVKNLQKPDPVILNALKSGLVLHGYEKLVEAVKKAHKAHGYFAIPKPEVRI